MMRLVRILAAGSVLVAAAGGQDDVAQGYWPQWRGPLGTGEAAPAADPPTEWSETTNVRWKVALPGLGYGTPVIWGDRVFVTTAVPFGEHVEPVPDDAPGAHDNAPVTQQHEFAVLALHRQTGEILWQTSLHKQLPHAGAHVSGSLASASPVVDGERVFAYFGSAGLYCLDHGGKLLWKTDLGDMRVKHGHGEGSSPVLWGETLVVNWDHEAQSFVVAFDARTGEERWRDDRDEVTSWSTPVVAEAGGRVQVVVSGTKRVRGYDLATGEVIWECGGLSNNVVASPVAAHGIVVAGSSYEKRAMFAVRLAGAEGDITGTDAVLWSRKRRTPYVPSPLLYGDQVYFLSHYQNVLSRVQLQTGAEPVGPFRMSGLFNIYASPVGAAGKVYVTDLDGSTLVLSHGEAPEILALNKLDDSFAASAAVAGDALFLRGKKALYCLAQ